MERSLVLAVIVAVGMLSACGGAGGEKGTAPSAAKSRGTTVQQAKPAPERHPPVTAPAEEEEEEEDYELDVFVDAEPDEGPPPLEVHFTTDIDEEEEKEGGPLKYEWDFGDGAKSKEKNPVHTYTKVGDYTATLTVTNAKGEKGTDEIDIFVEEDEE